MALQTSHADNNFFSIAGGITNCQRNVGVPIPDPPVFLPPDPQSFDAILKIDDGTHNLDLVDLEVAQGMEAAVDVNNRTNYISLKGRFGDFGHTGDQVITVKGGSHHITPAGRMISRGRKWDVRLGDWSDQCFDLTTDVNLSGLFHDDGGKIRVVVGRAAWPIADQLGPNCRILVFRSILEKAYWWAKWVYVKAWDLGLAIAAWTKAAMAKARTIFHR